ncbi:SDR family oxidoreductase [Pseudohaliea rubra]|uniref:Hydroxylase n=1 Tax=Pseudohaliea rubra DSM 19751 TaxID=1265313 RepID=A0A095XYY9_9GAMM|nr:NmrA family NAD(P)-binding protein [Pseudohaliea rubra]KGE04976.1 Hydroxylase [Pseudohaliea rubra DSM 19751]
METVLVIGATGDQGAAQVAALRSAGYPVAGASRSRENPVLPCGTPTVYLDLLEPGTLPPALAAFDTVFLNLPSASFSDPQTVIDGFENFLAAAQAGDVKRIVFNSSLYVADEPKGFPAHDTRYHIIERLLASTVNATAVCPVIFLENLMRGWALPSLREHRVLSYPHADELPVSWISLADLGRIMICLGEDPAAVGRKVIVGGPEALRGRETAAALSRAWGERIGFESLPVAAFAAKMGELFAGGERSAADRIAADLEAIYRWYNDAEPSPFTVAMDDFQARYRLKLTTVYDWARQNPLLAWRPVL